MILCINMLYQYGLHYLTKYIVANKDTAGTPFLDYFNN